MSVTLVITQADVVIAQADMVIAQADVVIAQADVAAVHLEEVGTALAGRSLAYARRLGGWVLGRESTVCKEGLGVRAAGQEGLGFRSAGQEGLGLRAAGITQRHARQEGRVLRMGRYGWVHTGGGRRGDGGTTIYK